MEEGERGRFLEGEADGKEEEEGGGGSWEVEALGAESSASGDPNLVYFAIDEAKAG